MDYEEIERRGLNVDEVSQDISTKIMKLEGIEAAIISKNLTTNKASDTLINRSALKNFYPQRSGDILIINKPHYVVNSHKKTVACNHGSPWKYDTYVPVIFAGYSIKAAQIYTQIEPNDIAPTLSAIVGAKYPSNSSRAPLKEVMLSISQ